jgi:hypothetical protein
MKCSDTVLAFFIFFTVGAIVAMWPAKYRDLHLFVSSKIPPRNLILFERTMKKPWFLTLTRVQGIILMSFGLYLLGWHLTHCG